MIDLSISPNDNGFNTVSTAAPSYAQCWAIFPCKPHSKQPATTHGFKDATQDTALIKRQFATPQNAAMACGASRVVVLDFDTAKAEYAGGELLDLLLEQYPTITQDTPSKGVHLIYTQRPGLTLTNKAGNLPKGVDVRGDGGYILLAPSDVTYTGKDAAEHGVPDGYNAAYAWRPGRGPHEIDAAVIPAFVVDMIMGPADKPKPETRSKDTGAAQDDVIAEFNRTHTIVELLAAHSYTLVKDGRDYARVARPDRDASSIVVFKTGTPERSYHHSTSDPLHTDDHARDAFDVWTCLEHGGDAKKAFEAAKREQGKWTDPKVKAPAADAAQDDKAPASKSPEIITSDIVLTALRSMGYAFAWNDLDDSIEVNGVPINDGMAATIRTQLRDRGFKHMEACEDAYRSDAYRNRYHPVKSYLEGLKWDGNNHIGALCKFIQDGHAPITYANGSTSVFGAFFSRWLIGAVAKVFEAGKVRAQNPMLVLDGPQNLGKSRFVLWLGSPLPHLFIEEAIRPDDKESTRFLASKWIWEVPELGSTTRRQDREALKAFITRAETTFRKPYDRHAVTKPALASFVGTINAEGGFLTDPTGNRRFLTVRLTSIDWRYSNNLDPNQIWAQAYALYKRGESWMLSPTELAARDELNRGYEIEDPYVEHIQRLYSIVPPPGEKEHFVSTVTLIEKLKDAGVKEANDRALSMAISTACRRLGVGGGMRRIEGCSNPVRGYFGLADNAAGGAQ